jgi:hypothetical protein
VTLRRRARYLSPAWECQRELRHTDVNFTVLAAGQRVRLRPERPGSVDLRLISPPPVTQPGYMKSAGVSEDTNKSSGILDTPMELDDIPS